MYAIVWNLFSNLFEQTYLEKRSMKAYKKEINSSENSRSSSGKSQTISTMKENSFKTNENVVNTTKVIIPTHQRRTASVSRTIGIVKPNFNGGKCFFSAIVQ